MGLERSKRPVRNTAPPYPSIAPATTPERGSTMATSLYFEDDSGRHKIRTSTPSTPTLSQLPKSSSQFGDFDGGFLKVPQVGRQFRLQ